MDVPLPGTRGFDYRGWRVKILVDCPDGASIRAMADLSLHGRHVCNLQSDDGLDAACTEWALSSRACDYIDAWFGRPIPRDLGSRELLLHPPRERRRA